MSGVCNYSCRIVNLDTGEVREIKKPVNAFLFYRSFNQLIRFFLGFLLFGETSRLRIDITKF